jgi:hypothetical protein
MILNSTGLPLLERICFIFRLYILSPVSRNGKGRERRKGGREGNGGNGGREVREETK